MVPHLIPLRSHIIEFSPFSILNMLSSPLTKTPLLVEEVGLLFWMFYVQIMGKIKINKYYFNVSIWVNMMIISYAIFIFELWTRSNWAADGEGIVFLTNLTNSRPLEYIFSLGPSSFLLNNQGILLFEIHCLRALLSKIKESQGAFLI